jgi:hypothetical protein
MKYMLLIYLNEQEWENLNPAEKQNAMDRGDKTCKELTAARQLLGGAPLAPVAAATTVREKDGKKVLTDGPFAETREQLGGYCLIDVKNLDEALEVAKRMHSTTVTSIEVRPLAEIAQ